MHKQDLIDFVANKANLTKKDATNAIDAVLEGIMTGLKTSQYARLIGFGSFNLKATPARKGRNPKTGAAIDVPETNRITFKAGTEFKKAVN